MLTYTLSTFLLYTRRRSTPQLYTVKDILQLAHEYRDKPDPHLNHKDNLVRNTQLDQRQD